MESEYSSSLTVQVLIQLFLFSAVWLGWSVLRHCDGQF